MPRAHLQFGAEGWIPPYDLKSATMSGSCGLWVLRWRGTHGRTWGVSASYPLFTPSSLTYYFPHTIYFQDPKSLLITLLLFGFPKSISLCPFKIFFLQPAHCSKAWRTVATTAPHTTFNNYRMAHLFNATVALVTQNGSLIEKNTLKRTDFSK